MPVERSSLNREIQQSLRTAEERYLNAVMEGADSLAAFNKDFQALQRKLAAGKCSSSLDEETISLADAVTMHLAVVAQSFLQTHTVVSTVQSQLISEWNGVFVETGSSFPPPYLSTQSQRLPKPSLQPIRHPTGSPITSALATILPSRNPSTTASVTESSRSASDPNPLPEFIEHAYKFFVAHIFNPYPTREEKQAIVDKTNNSGVTLTSISNWFTNARRRCGWSEILKRRCDGNRDEMIDLATRVFVKPDPRHPVDPQIVEELMTMKQSVESMYARKTRTSAWINEIEEMEELINPTPKEERLALRKRETQAEGEARRQQKEMLKEQRDFERRKRMMQAEALRKADQVATQQREQEKLEKGKGKGKEKDKNNKGNEPWFVISYPPTEVNDEEFVSEPSLVAGGKRKFDHNDGGSYDYSDHRHVSPAYSLSSSFNSDLSSESRVPSLTWSDSGDEQRPYKRSRSSSSTPYTNPSSLSPALQIPAEFDYSFTFEPPTGLIHDPAVLKLFDFSVNTGDSHVAMPPRGQKRRYDLEDGEPTPQAKRPKAIVASTGPDLAPAPPTPLFTPTPSVDGTPTGPASRRSSFAPVDLDAVLGLDHTNPQLVPNPQPDASLPIEVGIFNWPTAANSALDFPGASGTGDPSTDFAQLFQLFTEQLPSTFEGLEQTEQRLDPQLQVPSFDLPASDFLLQNPVPTANSNSQLGGANNLDFGGLMSGIMSEVAFTDFGRRFPEATQSTSLHLSQTNFVSPAWTPLPAAPSKTSPTPAELVQKAMIKERKRKELENKKAELERERERLAEEERRLDND